MAEFEWVRIDTGGEFTLRLIADDITGEPLRVEVTNTSTLTITVTLSRMNKTSTFEFVVSVGTQTFTVPPAVANKVVCRDGEIDEFGVQTVPPGDALLNAQIGA